MKAEIGDYIELVRMTDDPNPVPAGTKGTIYFVSEIQGNGITQYGVKWENGRTLMLCVPPDEFKHVDNPNRH